MKIYVIDLVPYNMWGVSLHVRKNKENDLLTDKTI